MSALEAMEAAFDRYEASKRAERDEDARIAAVARRWASVHARYSDTSVMDEESPPNVATRAEMNAITRELREACRQENSNGGGR
jgi:hypothetical protein